jgi:hypothetical protein
MNDTPDPSAAADISQTPPPPEAAGGDYPVTLEFERQEEYSRWLPFVKWLLLIPHYVVLIFLGLAAAVAIFISFFAVLFTRRYPRGMFDFVVGVYRWGMRVAAYLFLMTDRYPPFSMDDDADYPVTLRIEYPDEVDRWRPLVQWLLAIPYVLVAGILAYLAYLLVFFAFFTILFTKKFPEGLFNIVVVAFRWQMRGNAYEYWLTKRYPPWVWD